MWYHGLQPRWYWHNGAVSSVSSHSLAVQSPYQCPSVHCQAVEGNNICVMLNIKATPTTSTVFTFQICLKLILIHTLWKVNVISVCSESVFGLPLFALLLHLQHDHMFMWISVWLKQVWQCQSTCLLSNSNVSCTLCLPQCCGVLVCGRRNPAVQNALHKHMACKSQTPVNF